jgi:hypothetical protein
MMLYNGSPDGGCLLQPLVKKELHSLMKEEELKNACRKLVGDVALGCV